MSVHVRHYLMLLIVAFSASLLVFWQSSLTSFVQTTSGVELNNLPENISPATSEAIQKPKRQNVKGLYLTAYSAGSPKKINEIIDLIKKTELNAVVIDIKDYGGKVLYGSKVPLVNQLKTKDNRLGDARALIKKLHDNNIYVIARQTVFQDPILAEKKHEWGVKDSATTSPQAPLLGKERGSITLWRDKKGLAWVDPTQKAVWNYNLAIAKEAIQLGFDEINFDYVRFPSDGDMSRASFGLNGRTKEKVMRVFFQFISQKLANQPVWISIDMFGFVMEKHYGLSIGQRLGDAVDYVDYICPMMYPSHYPAGHLGFDNPAEYPAEVIENGMKMGLPYFDGKRAEVRPWIQAFDIGAVYSDGALIRAQIDAVEKYSNAGWLLWNASNKYSAAGLLMNQ